MATSSITVPTSFHAHPVRLSQRPGNLCDICEATIVDVAYACAGCDFDVCLPCFSVEQLAAIAKLRASTSGGEMKRKPDDRADEDKDGGGKKPSIRRPSNRGQAKMFHPSNGHQLFDILPPTTNTTMVSPTAAIISAMRERVVELGRGEGTNDLDANERQAAIEFGFMDPMDGVRLMRADNTSSLT